MPLKIGDNQFFSSPLPHKKLIQHTEYFQNKDAGEDLRWAWVRHLTPNFLSRTCVYLVGFLHKQYSNCFDKTSCFWNFLVQQYGSWCDIVAFPGSIQTRSHPQSKSGRKPAREKNQSAEEQNHNQCLYPCRRTLPPSQQSVWRFVGIRTHLH